MKQEDLRRFLPSPEKFADAFGVGSNRTSISPIDAGGVILAAIKGLHLRSARNATELGDLRREIEEIRGLLGSPPGRAGAPGESA
jgi:hypothetical protein